MTKKDSDSVLTIEELSEYLKIPKSTVYRLAQEGTVPGQKVGKHWRFLKSRIDAWLQESRKGEDEAGGD